MSIEHFTKDRIRSTVTQPGILEAVFESHIDFTDYGPDGVAGYRITVDWVEEDSTWYARLEGTKGEEGPLGDGPTKEAALLSLCCSLACLSDVWFHEATQDHEPRGVPRKRSARGKSPSPNPHPEDPLET